MISPGQANPKEYECPFCSARIVRTIVADEPGLHILKWICLGKSRHEFGGEWAESHWGKSEPEAVLIGIKPWRSLDRLKEADKKRPTEKIQLKSTWKVAVLSISLAVIWTTFALYVSVSPLISRPTAKEMLVTLI